MKHLFILVSFLSFFSPELMAESAACNVYDKSDRLSRCLEFDTSDLRSAKSAKRECENRPNTYPGVERTEWRKGKTCSIKKSVGVCRAPNNNRGVFIYDTQYYRYDPDVNGAMPTPEQDCLSLSGIFFKDPSMKIKNSEQESAERNAAADVTAICTTLIRSDSPSGEDPVETCEEIRTNPRPGEKLEAKHFTMSCPVLPGSKRPKRVGAKYRKLKIGPHTCPTEGMKSACIKSGATTYFSKILNIGFCADTGTPKILSYDANDQKAFLKGLKYHQRMCKKKPGGSNCDRLKVFRRLKKEFGLK